MCSYYFMTKNWTFDIYQFHTDTHAGFPSGLLQVPEQYGRKSRHCWFDTKEKMKTGLLAKISHECYKHNSKVSFPFIVISNRVSSTDDMDLRISGKTPRFPRVVNRAQSAPPSAQAEGATREGQATPADPYSTLHTCALEPCVLQWSAKLTPWYRWQERGCIPSSLRYSPGPRKTCSEYRVMARSPSVSSASRNHHSTAQLRAVLCLLQGITSLLSTTQKFREPRLHLWLLHSSRSRTPQILTCLFHFVLQIHLVFLSTKDLLQSLLT